MNRSLTFGERAVGLNFNPSESEEVKEIKTLFAEIIDILNDARKETTNQDKIRHLSVAITDAETAQMRAIKAVTWGK